MQYNIGESQALLWCSVIVLEMAGLDTGLMFCVTPDLTLFLAYSYFFTKTKAFVLIKKECRRFNSKKNS